MEHCMIIMAVVQKKTNQNIHIFMYNSVLYSINAASRFISAHCSSLYSLS